jgi:Flp pilus assembly protein TadG
MKNRRRWRTSFRRGIANTAVRLRHETHGSQIVEFAVALPLIIVFVVGIYDFSQAFGLKQKLSNAAREGARIGANQSTSDLTLSTPPTVVAIARVVGDYLQAVGVNDCGLASGTWTAASGGNLIWTFTANSGGCAGTVTLTVDRGFMTTASLGNPYGATMHIENTQVTLSYPYQWKFGNVISLISPSSSYARGSSQIQASATMQNMN